MGGTRLDILFFLAVTIVVTHVLVRSSVQALR